MTAPRIVYEAREVPAGSGKWYITIKGTTVILPGGPYSETEAEAIAEEFNQDKEYESRVKAEMDAHQTMQAQQQAEALAKRLQEDEELRKRWEEIIREILERLDPEPDM